MRVLFEDEMAVGADTRGIFLTRLRGRTTSEGLEGLTDAFERWSSTIDGPVVSLTFPRSGLPLPALNVRRAAAESMKRTDRITLTQGTVFDGQGFWVSAARSAMLALNVLAGRRHAAVFTDLHDACEWAVQVRGDLGASDPVAELRAAIDDLVEYADRGASAHRG